MLVSRDEDDNNEVVEVEVLAFFTLITIVLVDCCSVEIGEVSEGGAVEGKGPGMTVVVRREETVGMLDKNEEVEVVPDEEVDEDEDVEEGMVVVAAMRL